MIEAADMHRKCEHQNIEAWKRTRIASSFVEVRAAGAMVAVRGRHGQVGHPVDGGSKTNEMRQAFRRGGSQ
jgi:hypothetical protein